MALSKNLEEILKSMSPEAAKAQRKLWEENPAIAADMEKLAVPQSEFHRQLDAEKSAKEAAIKSRDEWKDWADKNKPKHAQVLSDLEKLEREKTEWLEEKARLVARRESGDTGATVDEDKLIEAVQKRIGGKPVTEARLTEIFTQEAKKLSDELKSTIDTERKKFFEETVPSGLRWQSEMLEVMQDYRAEFGKKMDKAEFSKFMTENQLTDPRKAYEEFTKPTREEKRINDEVEKRVNAKLAERTMPGVSSGESFNVTGEKSPLELYISGEIPEAVKNADLGSKVAATAAAAELRQQGAF